MLAWPRVSALLGSALTSLSLSASVVTAVVMATAGTAAAQAAQTPAQRAAALADEGKALSVENKHTEASEKFRQAIVLAPEGRFYMYLCISLSKEGKLGEALNACDAVERNGADDKTLTKTKGLMSTLRDEMKKQGMDPDKALAEGRAQQQTSTPDKPAGGGSGDGGGSNAVNVPPTLAQYNGRPPSVYTVPIVPNEYTWSVGGQFYGAGGTFGRDGYYAPGGGGFLLHGDIMLLPSMKLGAQVYLGYTSVPAEDANDGLTVADFGLAGFKHLCFGRACVTPLVGVQVAGMSPASDTNSTVAALGLRGEGSLSFALGGHYEHVLSAALGFNTYTAALGEYNEELDLGLDEPSTAVYLGFGYTYRFNTPIGRSAFITFD